MNTIIYLYVDTLVLITKDEIYYNVLLFLVKSYVYKGMCTKITQLTQVWNFIKMV